MSVISPDELIEQVKPWNSDSWKSLIEQSVAPISVLARAVERWFRGDPSADVARATAEAAELVLKTAEETLGDVSITYEIPEDPIECLRLLVEKCANTFLGVGEAGKFTLFAWTLRKITKEYLFDVLYPSLKDRDRRSQVFEILGLKEDEPLFIPAVESPLTENLTILGYLDYPSICRVEEWGSYVTLSPIPTREHTLGGSICRLVDCIVGVLSRPGILSGIEISADVVGNYLTGIPSRPTELYQYAWVGLNWRRAYVEFTDGSKWRGDYPWYIEGFSIKCVGTLSSDGTYDHIYTDTNLLSFTRWIMPSLVSGRTELLLSTDGRVFLTLERKVG